MHKHCHFNSTLNHKFVMYRILITHTVRTMLCMNLAMKEKEEDRERKLNEKRNLEALH